MKCSMTLLGGCAVAGFVALAGAQVAPPFFFPGQTAFEPQIGIVQSGAVLDAQVAVSADRKYVTLNMQPSNAKVLALRQFTFQSSGPALGVVGIGPAAAPSAARSNRTGSGAPPDPLNRSAAQIKAEADSWILLRHGMFRIAGAD